MGDLVARNPNHFGAKLALSEILLAKGDPKSALDNVQSVIDGNSQSQTSTDRFKAFYLLAQAQGALNNTEEQINALKGAVEIRPTEEVLVELGTLSLRLGKEQELGSYVRQCESLSPPCSSIDFYVLKTHSIHKSKAPVERVEAALSLALSKYPDEVRLLMLKGDIFEKINPNTAINSYLEVISIKPENAQPYISVAKLHVANGALGEAESVLMQGLAKANTKSPILRELSKVYQEQKQPMKQRNMLKKLVTDDPSNAEFRLELGNVLKGIGAYTDALEQFEELKKLGRLDDTAVMAYVDTLIQVGQLDKAQKEAQRYAGD